MSNNVYYIPQNVQDFKYANKKNPWIDLICVL